MHHFIFPKKDTYISNDLHFLNKNFGLDEILRIGSIAVDTRITSPTTTFTYGTQSVSNWFVNSFTGTITTGSLFGTSSFISGSILNSSTTCSFTCSYFSGSLTGSYNGFITGSFDSSSNFTGSLTNFSGSIYSTGINGIVTGSLIANSFKNFNGYVTQFRGYISATSIYGTNTISQSSVSISARKNINRALLKFDVTSISKSVASNDIILPQFFVNLKVARLSNSPLSYSIYAFPISQSWEMGNGYSSDGGSLKGASWYFKDFDLGNLWNDVSDPNGLSVIDFVNFPDRATGSFARGGATWYTSSICSQSFNYEVADIRLDVTSIVNKWISGSILNDGIILLSSDELESTGSDLDFRFFSRDTNTIYSPYLDVGWDDSTFITGSEFTNSIQITAITGSIASRFTSGSILGTSVNVILSGSFTGSSYITGSNITGTVVLTAYNSLISGSVITSNVSASYISGSVKGNFLNGLLSGSYFTGSSDGTSSFNVLSTGSYVVSGSVISGSADSSNQVEGNISGNLVNGPIDGIYNNGQFSGVFSSGTFFGFFITGSVTGSYTTSSFISSSIITSSFLNPLEFNLPFVTVIQNLHPTVRAGNIIRVNVFAREEFPLKNFNRSSQFSQFLTPQYLPSSSYYSIKDNETEQIILDFDNYTKISCDQNGNYFLLDTTGLPQERYFKVLIRTEQSSSIYTFDNGNIFKIVR